MSIDSSKRQNFLLDTATVNVIFVISLKQIKNILKAGVYVKVNDVSELKLKY